MTIYYEAEKAAEFVKRAAIDGSSFELAIADGVTFAGKPDDIGLGMAIVVDACLARGLEPDGFEQHDGHRVYRYKATEA